MFYVDKLHLVEKGNIVLVTSICSSMEYSHRIITRNEFKTSHKLATAFQLNNPDFPVLSSKYVCKVASSCPKVPPSKFISNVVAKSLRKFVCVRKFVSVPKFAQSVRRPTYRIVKRCDFDFVNLANVSTNVFHASAPDVVNVTIVPPYEHFNSTKNVSKSVLTVSAVYFIPAPTLKVNPAMSSHVRNVLLSVNTTCRVRKVSPYIRLSVNTSTTLVNYASHNVCHVQRPKCVTLSLECQLLRHRYTQSLLKFCLIRFSLLSQQKLF